MTRTRTRLALLAALWLGGCGIYGPPERSAAPRPGAPAEQSAAAQEDCEDPEQPR